MRNFILLLSILLVFSSNIGYAFQYRDGWACYVVRDKGYCVPAGYEAQIDRFYWNCKLYSDGWNYCYVQSLKDVGSVVKARLDKPSRAEQVFKRVFDSAINSFSSALSSAINRAIYDAINGY